MGYYQDTTFPTATGTLDKSRLENFADLLDPAYITKPYVYMQRIVAIDPDESKRGIWVLQANDHSNPANWKLIGTGSPVTPPDGTPADLSAYVLKEDGKTLISIEEITRLSQITQVDITGKVDKVTGKSLILDSEILRLSTVTNQDISGKVDKVIGKSLLSDTEIVRLASLQNVDITNKVDKVTGKSLLSDSEIARLATLQNVDITNKVDKVTGKSLIADSEIARLLTLFNVDITGKANISYVDSQDAIVIALINALKAGSTETIASLKTSIGALEAIVGSAAPDANNFISTVTEILQVFSTFPEGTDILNLFSSKVDKEAGKSLLSDTEIARLLTLQNVDISGKVDKVEGKSLLSDAEITRLLTLNNVDITGKVDKVTGKSLLSDTEIARLLTLYNVDITGKVDKVAGKSLILDTEIERLSHLILGDGVLDYGTITISGNNISLIGSKWLSSGLVRTISVLVNYTIPPADASGNLRIDIVVGLPAGGTQYIQGVPSANAVPPTTPDGTVLLQEVFVDQVTITKGNGGGQTGYLEIKKNLSDLSNVITARFNLGLGNVNNTSDVNKPVSTLQAAAINAREPAITATTTADFWSGAKTFLNFASAVFSSVLPTLAGGNNTPITAGITIKTAFQDLQAQITNLLGKVGTLTSLTTDNKNSLVEAINEVNAKPSGGSNIDETNLVHRTGADETITSNKDFQGDLKQTSPDVFAGNEDTEYEFVVRNKTTGRYETYDFYTLINTGGQPGDGAVQFSSIGGSPTSNIALTAELSKYVLKVIGKSLVLDTEIARLATLVNGSTFAQLTGAVNDSSQLVQALFLKTDKTTTGDLTTLNTTVKSTIVGAINACLAAIVNNNFPTVTTGEKAITVTAAGPQKNYDLQEQIVPSAPLTAADWSTGIATVTGFQGQVSFDTNYRYDCSGTNQWRRTINYNSNIIDWWLADIDDSAGAKTSAQLQTAYPTAVIGQRVWGSLYVYDKKTTTQWMKTATVLA